jgi:hypothetical protein
VKIGHLPGEIVMQADDMVDAALAGLDQGGHAAILPLPDAADWDACEAAWQTLIPDLSSNVPAARYRTGGRDDGSSRDIDGRLDIMLSTLGGMDMDTKPDQIFPEGWSA